MKTIEFGIDCDPFARRQESFQKDVSAILGREVKPISKSFGCWTFKESVTESQHIEIAKLTYDYYIKGGARGVMCTDLKQIIKF